MNEAAPGLLDRVLLIANALDQTGISYAFGGALAFGFHAEPRATHDIDINIFSPESEPLPALHALAGIGVPIDDERDVALIRRDGQIRLRWDQYPVDLFFATFEFLDACQDRVWHVPFRGRQIPILSPEDLAVCKIAFNREKDWLDLRQMIEIQGEKLEAAYIMHWLRLILGSNDPRTQRFQALLDS